MMRAVLLLLMGSLVVERLTAHEVVWWENPDGFLPGNVMGLYYDASRTEQGEQYIYVRPSNVWEPCTVGVNLSPPSSSLIKAKVVSANPTNEVIIAVSAARAPEGRSESATLSGEWHATGLPANAGCTATNPNPFMVTVTVFSERPRLIFDGPGPGPTPRGRTLKLDTFDGRPMGLQASEGPGEPWYNVGVSSSFTLFTVKSNQFFRGIIDLGGSLDGLLIDNTGAPLFGSSLGLPFGGPASEMDKNAMIALKGLPEGINLLSLSKPITFTLPGTASNRTEIVGLKIVVPVGQAPVMLQMTADIKAAPGTNQTCNCVPWCAIGFGSLNDDPTPVYFAGGSILPQDSPADCDQPSVVVTAPSGKTIPIQAGDNFHQNSGPNPASGKWTITATVCNQTITGWVIVP
jgi:hypothetical protein